MNKTIKILIWIITLLVVLNLTTIGTILHHNREEQEDNVSIVLDENRQNPLTGRYFRQALDFNDGQMEAFRKANRKFQPYATKLILEMDSLKTEMFNELNKPQPDSLKLRNLSDHIGEHHTELKILTNDFYLQLKSICDSLQRVQLAHTFLPLYRDETVNARRGYFNRKDSTGIGQKYRHGYGRSGSR